MLLTLILLAGSALAGGSPGADGVIEGVVLRAVDRTPVAGAEVVLRAKYNGEMLSLAETTADAAGRFRFEHLPANGAYAYLPAPTTTASIIPAPACG